MLDSTVIEGHADAGYTIPLRRDGEVWEARVSGRKVPKSVKFPALGVVVKIRDGFGESTYWDSENFAWRVRVTVRKDVLTARVSRNSKTPGVAWK